MRKLRRRARPRPVNPSAPRRVYNHALNDFVMLPGVPNRSLDIAPGTVAMTQGVGDQVGMPVPDNMLPALPNSSANGYYADQAYIKSWDGTSVVGACSPYPNASGSCGSNQSIIPINVGGGQNNAMVTGDAFVSEDMLRDMMPGGPLAIGPSAAYSPFAFDIFAASEPKAETTLQRTVASVVDPLVGIPTSYGLTAPIIDRPLSFQGGTVASGPTNTAMTVGPGGVVVGANAGANSSQAATGVLSNYTVMSERNALGRLGSINPAAPDFIKVLIGAGILWVLYTWSQGKSVTKELKKLTGGR